MKRGYRELRDYNRILFMETKSRYMGLNVKIMEFPVLGGVRNSTHETAQSGDLLRRST